jgi:hypothetical protein
MINLYPLGEVSLGRIMPVHTKVRNINVRPPPRLKVINGVSVCVYVYVRYTNYIFVHVHCMYMYSIHKSLALNCIILQYCRRPDCRMIRTHFLLHCTRRRQHIRADQLVINKWVPSLILTDHSEDVGEGVGRDNDNDVFSPSALSFMLLL